MSYSKTIVPFCWFIMQHYFLGLLQFNDTARQRSNQQTIWDVHEGDNHVLYFPFSINFLTFCLSFWIWTTVIQYFHKPWEISRTCFRTCHFAYQSRAVQDTWNDCGGTSWHFTQPHAFYIITSNVLCWHICQYFIANAHHALSSCRSSSALNEAQN